MGIESDRRTGNLEGIEGRGTKVGSEGQHQQLSNDPVATDKQERQQNGDLWRGVSVPAPGTNKSALSEQEQGSRNRELFRS